MIKIIQNCNKNNSIVPCIVDKLGKLLMSNIEKNLCINRVFYSIDNVCVCVST